MDIWVVSHLELANVNNTFINALFMNPSSRLYTQKWNRWVGGGFLINLNRFLLGDDFGLLPFNTVSMETYWVKVNTECQLCSQATMFIVKMAPDW